MCIFITTPVSVKVNTLASDPEQLSHPGEKVAGRQGEVWNTWALVESLLLRYTFLMEVLTKSTTMWQQGKDCEVSL